MSETERYSGLTTADKGALMDAKEKGAEWIARDENGMLCGYATKPSKYNSTREWYTDDGFELITKFLEFVKWSDAEPVNIDLAIVQIAEMESAEEPLTNRDKWMQLWNESDEILARKFVEQEWFGTLWCVYMFSEEPISRHEKYEDAIQAAIIALNSPYTEGDTDEG